MHLFGREVERAAIAEALASHRAVVLTGPSGIGKSALAASFCMDQAALWIDARISLHGDVLSLAATGRRDQARLAVIDDVSPDEPPERIQSLIEELGVPVLVTSRRPIDLDIPHVAPAPLSPQDGVALVRSHLGCPARAATLDGDSLTALTVALGGVPDALRAAARRLELESLAELLEDATTPLPAAQIPHGPVHHELLSVLVRLPGPVSPRLLAQLLNTEVRPALAELSDQGLVERFPLGTTWVRLRPLGPQVSDGGEDAKDKLLSDLSELLPEWEALAEEVENGWRTPTARLREDLPALEWLSAHAPPDVALRAAFLAALVYRRLGPERRVCELDDRLPEGGEPGLRQRWQTQLARSLVHIGEGSLGLAALDKCPAPKGSLLAIEQLSLRGRLLDISGQPEEGARLQTQAMALAAGTPALGNVSYRDAIRRYWSGDFQGALDSLAQTLDCSDPEVHGVRVVRATLLKTLIRRELGADSGELLAELNPIDTLWRRVECESGATVLVVLAVLLVDLGRWAEGDAHLSEAIPLQLRMGLRGHAIRQILQRSSLVYLSGRVPSLLLAPELGVSSEEEAQGHLSPTASAELHAWQGVRMAALGHSSAVPALADAALEELVRHGRPLRTGEFAAYLAAALIGAQCQDEDLIERYLDQVQGSPQLEALRRHLLHAIGRGPRPEPGPGRVERNVLLALMARREGIRVAEDGSRVQLPGAPPISMKRKQVLRRILAGLAQHPRGLDIQGVIAHGWPDARLVGDSGRRRAEVAIYNLRRLGLRDAIVVDRDASGTRWRLEAVVHPADA